MSRNQNLVDAQVSVNRCVFEMNREAPDGNYILQESAQAIESLSNAMVDIYSSQSRRMKSSQSKRKEQTKRTGRGKRVTRETGGES